MNLQGTNLPCFARRAFGLYHETPSGPGFFKMDFKGYSLFSSLS
jgi:hypothetical protein